MLASKYSLKGNKNFERVEKEGRIFQSDSFGAAYIDRRDKELSLFGFIVSNKISPDSAIRNHIKRALKEAVRQSYLELKKGYDVVFLAKQCITRKPTVEIMNEVRNALKAIDLYR